MNYKQGSDWRKWDLHVHTPDSLENHFTGATPEEKWENYLTDLENLPEEIKVLGINDYLFIDGYSKLVEYKSQGRLPNIDTLFPVIEFRIKKFAGHREFKRINFHVIFSDKLKPEIIQTQFLNSLQGKYKLSPGNEGIKWNAAITKDSLTDLGNKIKASVPPDQLVHYSSDLIEGFNNLNLEEEDIINLLRNNTYLQNCFLTAVGKTEWESLAWGDSSIAEKKDIINKVDLVFISSESPATYENAKIRLQEQAVNYNLLDCSDAHYNSLSKLKDRIGKCYTWIKADTTFEGLRQVIFEFSDRVFVGDRPPSMEKVDKYPTKYIKSLSVLKTEGSQMPENWFEGMPEIELNSNLVAIIGNKGNGKSAIADIIGLIGNSHNYDDFSFLNNKKFLKRKPYNRGAAFEAAVEWRSGYKTNYATLSSEVDLSVTEKVKYLPQNFLEKICSDDLESENFEIELKNVVFSHMDDSQKLGQNSFDDYVDYKTSEINLKVSSLKSKIHEFNSEISALEEKEHPSYLVNLEDKRKVKEDELSAHKENKPKEIKQPDADAELKLKQEAISKSLDELIKERNLLEDEIEKVSLQKNKLNVSLVDLENFHQGAEEIERQILGFKERFSTTFKTYEIKPDDLLKYELNLKLIETKIENAKSNIVSNNKKLDVSDEKSLKFREYALSQKIKEVKNQLSEPFRIYQKYIEELAQWNKREKEIIGDKTKEDTIAYYTEKIRFVNEVLKTELDSKYEQRLSILRQLYSTKNEIINLYKEAYNPVTELIHSNNELMEDYKIEFDASLKLTSFENKFFNFINQGNKGSFSGKEEGYHRILSMLEDSTFNSFEELNRFMTEIIEKLNYDCRDGRGNERRYLSEQLRKDITQTEFYDYLFGLEYLETTYQLKLGGKDLTELSPGERGALLLIFYLLLDKGDIPLIIDQPEENLDNESVYNILVKFIKKAKERRQVIIVTHNPNLAVVCDAEQLIRVHIDKENKNKFTYISGAIENKIINDEIVKILEGTQPAFTNRKLKYANVTENF